MDERVGLSDAAGDCIARTNLQITFFAKRPFAQMVKGAAYCAQWYLRAVPPGTLQWSIIGPTSGTHKPLTEKDVARCLSMLTSTTAKQKDVHFRLMGPAKYGPDYRLVINGYKQPAKRGFLDQSNAIEMRFPREFLLATGHDRFVAIVKDLFEAVSADSGYAAPALCVGKESEIDQAGAYLAPLAMKHHGYDVSTTLYSAAGLGTRSRGARWLTLLSNDLLNELGGTATLRDRLSRGVEITDTTNGIMLRAGQVPELGDTNRNETTPLLASVARVIEPVTQFGDNALLPIFANDPERRDRWERRFWWQVQEGP
jgi:hypothetical protein